MSGARFTDEFKRDAVAQVKDRGYPLREVAERLGVSTKSIYTWQRLFSRPPRYAFIAENRQIFAVRAMCRMFLVHPGGFYTWLRESIFQRALEDQRQSKLVAEAWDDSGKDYGYHKLHDDLCDLGEDISPNRAWRLARWASPPQNQGLCAF